MNRRSSRLSPTPVTPITAAAQVVDAIRRAQSGDADAFELVYRAHVNRIYALCFRMAGDPVHARELVQDVFIRAWEKVGSFRGDSAFSSWLHRVAVNVVLMDERLAARRAEDCIESDTVEVGRIASQDAAVGLRIDLDEAIATLPPMARQVLVLYDVEGYEHREIGTMLGIAAGTSKAHLFRARRLLREKLDA
ncbi:MAG: sigma-70 family RNA polymerase sigma factor [Gemmatimonadota bacterium]